MLPVSAWQVINTGIFTQKVFVDISNKELFSFFGSYIGLLGGIIFGIVAFLQTQMINDQGERLKNMQETLMGAELSPIVEFKKVILPNIFSSQKLPLKYKSAIYKQSDGKNKINGKNIAILKIKMQNKGIYPIGKIKIKKITWEICRKKYPINYPHELRFNEITYVPIDGTLLENDTDFWEQLHTHYNYNNNFSNMYRNSELSIDFLFENHTERHTLYKIKCFFDAEDNSRGLVCTPYVLSCAHEQN